MRVMDLCGIKEDHKQGILIPCETDMQSANVTK